MILPSETAVLSSSRGYYSVYYPDKQDVRHLKADTAVQRRVGPQYCTEGSYIAYEMSLDDAKSNGLPSIIIWMKQ